MQEDSREIVTNDDLKEIEFSSSKKIAEEYFKKYEHLDPFAKKIPPALLNSHDISEYVRVTGMVYPFEREKGKLKSASYEVDFDGEVYYWKDGDKKDFTIETVEPDKPFVIPKNSIVFVSPKTMFRLPDYIALRFNLRIKHVHRGLLLGTGPLVDPGFVGRLFIPLHNLTSEPYTITGGEGLIWVEFTKISPHLHWIESAEPNGYCHFPVDNREVLPQQYLNKTKLHAPARSSIPLEIEEAALVSKKMGENVRKMRQVITVGGTATLVIAVLGIIFGVVLPTYGLVQDATNYVRESGVRQSELEKTIEAQAVAISKLNKELLIMQAEARKRVEEKPKLVSVR